MTIEYQNITGNRKYKDALFRMVFSKKEDLLLLYNAINDTNYSNVDELEIKTLKNVLYMTIKNDISFMIDCSLNLYEHQSTYNPNMPLRGAFYLLEVLKIYADQNNLNLFRSTLQKIPTPQYFVFYNGTKEQPDRHVERLSDAFMTKNGCLECEVTMLNINYGHNKELMEKCRPLEEYAIFVDTVRRYASDKTLKLAKAIALASDECIQKGILVDILTTQRAEVQALILETFDKEQYEKDLIEDAKEEGRVEGKAEERAEKIKLVVDLVRDSLLSVAEAAKRLGMSEEELKRML